MYINLMFHVAPVRLLRNPAGVPPSVTIPRRRLVRNTGPTTVSLPVYAILGAEGTDTPQMQVPVLCQFEL